MKQLEPVDKKRCQAEKSNGQSFMTLGGGPKLERCTNKPDIIAIETEPGEDGKTGSMSLCADCLTIFMKKMPKGFATFSNIDDYHQPN